MVPVRIRTRKSIVRYRLKSENHESFLYSLNGARFSIDTYGHIHGLESLSMHDPTLDSINVYNWDKYFEFEAYEKENFNHQYGRDN